MCWAEAVSCGPSGDGDDEDNDTESADERDPAVVREPDEDD
jgi:hypothetical protein